jgi:regulator of sigma E protease
VGFGRKLIKKRVGETVYTLSILPFGGYVKFAGESEEPGATQEAPRGGDDLEMDDSDIDPKRYFVSKSPLVRGAVVFAGPFSNYVLALVLYFGIFAFYGVQVLPTTEVGRVTAGSPADEAGLAVTDQIIAVNGEDVDTWRDLETKILTDRETAKTLTVRRGNEVFETNFTSTSRNDTIVFGFGPHIPKKIGRVKRDGPAYLAGLRSGDTIDSINDTIIASYHDIERIIHAKPEETLYIKWTHDGVQRADSITPQAKKVPKDGSETELTIVGQIGVGPYYEIRRMPITRAVGMSFNYANTLVVKIVQFLRRFFMGKLGMDAVGGPILITQMAGEMARWGFDNLLYFLAFFSINLCIFNLLPLLPFDGGHLTLFLYEGIARRKVNRRVREILTQAGFILLILLMAFVVVVDVTRCTGSSPGLF